MLDTAERRLFALAQNRTLRVPHGSLSFIRARYRSAATGKCAWFRRCVTGTPTGFDCLDEMTCGLQPGDLVLLAAVRQWGKPLWHCPCVSSAALRTEESVLVFSIEMPKEQLILRMLSMLGRVELNHLRSGNMDDDDWARVSSAVGMALGDGGMDALGERLIIDDCSQRTPSSLRASARRYTRLYGKPALIMVDYLQLIRAPGWREPHTGNC